MLSPLDSFRSEDASATRVVLDLFWSKLRTHARRLVAHAVFITTLSIAVILGIGTAFVWAGSELLPSMFWVKLTLSFVGLLVVYSSLRRVLSAWHAVVYYLLVDESDDPRPTVHH
ncbi:hypothetical protein V5735_05450 (plasmid) [Haladaptatus sp. SPP-AMP-3]|uniref:hypothetical protein n=1 Tax=Haladaptatus sp. SPP-AMP-3 TaxID=3121295 RepID=UPI003C2E8D7D